MLSIHSKSQARHIPAFANSTFFFLLQSPVFMYILIHGNLKFQFLLNVSYPPQGYKTDYKTSYDSLKVQIANEMS